jgi:hypothetical protein
MTAPDNTEWIEEWAKRCLRYFRDPHRTVKCERCHGSGKDSGTRCGTCRGKGSYPQKEGHALYDRAIVDRLRDCRAFGATPPAALIELIEFRLLSGRKAKAKQRDSERWIAAAKYQAVNPRCSSRELVAAVKRAVPYQSLAPGTIISWRKDGDFKADVAFYSEFAGDLLASEFATAYRELFVDPFK